MHKYIISATALHTLTRVDHFFSTIFLKSDLVIKGDEKRCECQKIGTIDMYTYYN